MPRFLSRALVAATFAVLLAACDSSEPAATLPPPASADPTPVALPLAVGNEWTYRTVETRLENGGATVRSVDTLATSMLRVTEALDIGGETWFRLVGTERLAVFFDPSRVYANRADGLYVRAADGSGRPTRLLAFPAQAGAQFTRSFWIGGVDHPQGLSADSNVSLKVTDLPVTVGVDAYEGFLYTVAPQRFRVGTGRYEVDARSRPFHELVVPNVGYAQYECGYYGAGEDVPAGVFALVSSVRFTLESFTLAQRAE